MLLKGGSMILLDLIHCLLLKCPESRRRLQFFIQNDAPLNSLEYSNASLKVKTLKGVGVCSFAHNTLGVEGCARALRWGLKQMTSESIIHSDVHKPNNKLVSA